MSTDPIAIDVALLPGHTMVAKAVQVNAELLRNHPSGFPLDSDHVPHVTLLQAFVPRGSVEEIGTTLESLKLGEELEATGFGFHDSGKLSAGGFEISQPAWLLQAHARAVEGVAPFVLAGGDSHAFFTTPEEPRIDSNTIDYVGSYMKSQAGDRYHPHLTVGIAETDFLRRYEGADFEPFSFAVEGLALYQLGNFGTCRRLLRRVK